MQYVVAPQEEISGEPTFNQYQSLVHIRELNYKENKICKNVELQDVILLLDTREDEYSHELMNKMQEYERLLAIHNLNLKIKSSI